MAIVTKAISAENTFSDAVRCRGYFNISIYGTFSATITVQRSFDDGSTWLDVDDFTAASESVGLEAEIAKYRIGVKTGNYTSGTVNVRIGENDIQEML